MDGVGVREDGGEEPGGRNGLEEQQLLGVSSNEDCSKILNFVQTAAVTRTARGA